jgi:hypothetical protein
MKMHPDLEKPSRIKRIPSSTVVYEKGIHPPLTDDITKLQELITQTLIGKRVSKRFSTGVYLGKVTSTWTNDNHHQYWRVRYDDEDSEDLNLNEIRDSLSLYKLYPHEHRHDGTIPDISNKRGADISREKGTDISRERGADISNKRGADILNDRGR